MRYAIIEEVMVQVKKIRGVCEDDEDSEILPAYYVPLRFFLLASLSKVVITKPLQAFSLI